MVLVVLVVLVVPVVGGGGGGARVAGEPSREAGEAGGAATPDGPARPGGAVAIRWARVLSFSVRPLGSMSTTPSSGRCAAVGWRHDRIESTSSCSSYVSSAASAPGLAQPAGEGGGGGDHVPRRGTTGTWKREARVATRAYGR